MSDWSSEDVIVWLKANVLFESFVDVFTQNEIDGYTLLTLTDQDMVETLGMFDSDLRNQLKRAVKKLIVVWIRYGKNCEGFFREQADSLYFDELSMIDQSSSVHDDTATQANFSIVKMLERASASNLNNSVLGGGSHGRDSFHNYNPLTETGALAQDKIIDEQERSRLMQESKEGQAIAMKADHFSRLLEQENEDDEFNGGTSVDPTEDIYIKTLSSFKFLINFSELAFHHKKDLIQKASSKINQCSLYQANWLGMKVSLRKFSAKNMLHSH